MKGRKYPKKMKIAQKSHGIRSSQVEPNEDCFKAFLLLGKKYFKVQLSLAGAGYQYLISALCHIALENHPLSTEHKNLLRKLMNSLLPYNPLKEHKDFATKL